MPNPIQPENVTRVLLPDGWWLVKEGSLVLDRPSWFSFTGVSVAEWLATEGDPAGRSIVAPWSSLQALQHGG